MVSLSKKVSVAIFVSALLILGLIIGIYFFIRQYPSPAQLAKKSLVNNSELRTDVLPPSITLQVLSAKKDNEDFTRLQIRGHLKSWKDNIASIQTAQDTVNIEFPEHVQYACKPPLLPVAGGGIMPISGAYINLLYQDDFGHQVTLNQIKDNAPPETEVVILAIQKDGQQKISGYVFVTYLCPKEL